MQNTQYITDVECNAALHTERHIWLFKYKRKKLGMHIYPASQQVWFKLSWENGNQNERFENLVDAVNRYNEL